MMLFRVAAMMSVLACLASARAMGTNKLVSGNSDDRLYSGYFIMAKDRSSYVIMQEDGNLVLYDCEGRPLWESGTGTNQEMPPGYYAVMQPDGNLVIYSSSDSPVWATNAGTSSQDGPYRAVLQNDNNFIVYSNSRQAVWQSYTHGLGGQMRGCAPCADKRCSNVLAMRQPPPPTSEVTQWANYLWFALFWYKWRLMAAALVLAAAAVAWRRYRGSSAAGKAPSTTDAEYGSMPLLGDDEYESNYVAL